jgi:hypothetical protein
MMAWSLRVDILAFVGVDFGPGSELSLPACSVGQ